MGKVASKIADVSLSIADKIGLSNGADRNKNSAGKTEDPHPGGNDRNKGNGNNGPKPKPKPSWWRNVFGGVFGQVIDWIAPEGGGGGGDEDEDLTGWLALGGLALGAFLLILLLSMLRR
jgi:hypothetical protein